MPKEKLDLVRYASMNSEDLWTMVAEDTFTTEKWSGYVDDLAAEMQRGLLMSYPESLREEIVDAITKVAIRKFRPLFDDVARQAFNKVSDSGNKKFK